MKKLIMIAAALMMFSQSAKAQYVVVEPPTVPCGGYVSVLEGNAIVQVFVPCGYNYSIVPYAPYIYFAPRGGVYFGGGYHGGYYGHGEYHHRH